MEAVSTASLPDPTATWTSYTLGEGKSTGTKRSWLPWTRSSSKIRRMSDLLIRIKKKNDGSAALSCLRADGSVTWQRQNGLQGRFFPLHDLTHYAVETVLGHTRGFYGLVAEGWDLTDFGNPWRRGPLPPEALVSEFIVGFLDRERGAGVEWSAAELRWPRPHISFNTGSTPSISLRMTTSGTCVTRVESSSPDGPLFQRAIRWSCRSMHQATA